MMEFSMHGSSQKKIPDNPKWFQMVMCTKCSSENTKTVSLTYPVTHECRSCGNVFVEGRKSLVDE